ncbi:MAG: hypothetical protein AVO35_08770 [Candidatus Aegiribacteria sp. MLS_C]|nr:MAG: hypothetical protein AVO35_08770 [Candidatus Aegiribacteria sp. MLS_C]
MRYIIPFLLVFPLAASAVTLDSWLNFTTGGDSLSPQLGTLDIGGLLQGNGWGVLLQEKHVSMDTTGVVDRVLNSYSRTDLDISIQAGPVRINPDLVWTVDLGDDEPELVLPVQGGIAYREGSLRPGLGIEAQVSENLKFFADGFYWSRDIVHEDGSDLGWTDTRFSGGATWDSPWIASLTVAGLTHNTVADYIDYDNTWNRYDVSVALHPSTLPRNMYVTGEVTYSVYDGRDFLDAEIADRLTSRVRLMQMGIIPSISVNTIFESSVDFDGETVRNACTALESRLVWRFLRDREVPSAVILSGRLTRSSIRTEKAGIFSRINIYRGLSLLAEAEARVTPTSVAGAGPDRQRYVFGPGLEYQFGNRARIWGIVEQERTDLTRNENWWRIRSGLEFYPGTVSF